jgi:hypothetical protein
MTEPEFWKMIDSSRRGDPEGQADRLTDTLAAMPVAEILSFGQWWDTMKQRAYNWDLWGAAYLMNGGCSNDGFTDFRSWLLLQGKKVFEAAVADLDSLADVDVGPEQSMWECYPAATAYGRVTKGKRQPGYVEALTEAFPGDDDTAGKPTGDRWDFDDDDEVEAHLPKLFEKFADA